MLKVKARKKTQQQKHYMKCKVVIVKAVQSSETEINLMYDDQTFIINKGKGYIVAYIRTRTPPAT